MGRTTRPGEPELERHSPHPDAVAQTHQRPGCRHRQRRDAVACIDGLEAQFPGLKDRLLDETGELRRFVNIYINGEDVRFAQGVQTRLKPGDEISIVPAVAGGAEEPRTEPRLKYYRASPGAYQALKAASGLR